ncbi:MAG: hypothetical protein KDB40_13915 [Acidimicrobiales bacterium]|nr:hypothetical protein [Acidimicrobiales bacterium]MCB9392427.1 hypothetical protein [Acidimicrobiaceae bacterium]
MNDEPDEVVSILAIVDGDTWLRSATVAHRAPGVVQVRTDEPVPLPIGSVVGLQVHGSTQAGPSGPTTVTLAVVSDTIGDTVTALRPIERRS